MSTLEAIQKVDNNNIVQLYIASKSRRKVYPDILTRLNTRNLIYKSGLLENRGNEKNARLERIANARKQNEEVHLRNSIAHNTSLRLDKEALKHEVPNIPAGKAYNRTYKVSQSFTADQSMEMDRRRRNELNRSLVLDDSSHGNRNAGIRSSVSNVPFKNVITHTPYEKEIDLDLLNCQVALDNTYKSINKGIPVQNANPINFKNMRKDRYDNAGHIDALDELKADVMKNDKVRHSTIDLNADAKPLLRNSNYQSPSRTQNASVLDLKVINPETDYFKADIEQQRFRKKLENITQTQEKNYQQFVKQVQVPKKDAVVKMGEFQVHREEEVNNDLREFDTIKAELKKTIKSNYKNVLEEQLHEKVRKQEQKEQEKKEMLVYSNELINANKTMNEKLTEMKKNNQKVNRDWLNDQRIEKVNETKLLQSPTTTYANMGEDALGATTVQNLHALKNQIALPITGMRSFSPPQARKDGEIKADTKYKDTDLARKITHMHNPVMNPVSIGCTSPYIIREMYTNAQKNQLQNTSQNNY